jgi:hypothetical protein
MGLKLNRTRQILLYVHANILGDTINNIKKNTDAIIDVRKEVDLEVNTEKTNYVDI